MNQFRNVYIGFALVVPVTIFAFWKTYVRTFFRIPGELPESLTPLTHVHAALMFLWLLMLIAQAWFIRTRRFRPHRCVGRSSYVIAPLIILSGLAVLHQAFNRTPPQGVNIQEVFRLDELAFGMVLAFAITWGLAIAFRRQTPLHVRFMISTGFAVATAIIWRVFYFWVPGCDTDQAALIGNGAVLALLLFILIAVDWQKGVKRSPYWVVTIVQGVAHLGYWTFARTEGYFAFCQWFAELPLPVS
jgi:hypothetical protein